VMRNLIRGPSRNLDGAMKVPDGFKVKMGKAVYCETDFTSKEIKSNYDFKAEAKDSFSLGGFLDIGFASFDYSSESKEFRESNGKFRKMMVSSKAECSAFVLELDDLEKNPPTTSPSFKFIADTVSTDEEFYVLFDMFGLHFPSKVLFGSRYGYTQYTDEKGYKSVLESSQSSTTTAGVSYTVGAKKGGVKFGITVSAKVKNTVKDTTRTVNAVQENFEQVKEFSVGKRMPDEGGIQAWVRDVGDEPMPIRFELMSLCNHPALLSKKDACVKASTGYCDKYLKLNDPSINCNPPPKSECLFDVECGKYKYCEEGVCHSEPECRVKMFQDDNMKGSTHSVGSIYYSEYPHGYETSLGSFEKKISSLTVSGGCNEVVLMDQDACKLVYSDNMVITLRKQNTPKDIGDIPYDLDNDVCRIKVTPKRRWQ